MATLNLPTFPANPDHKYNIVLDGVTVILEFHYNARADRWSRGRCRRGGRYNTRIRNR